LIVSLEEGNWGVEGRSVLIRGNLGVVVGENLLGESKTRRLPFF